MKVLSIGYTNSIHFWRWNSFLQKVNHNISILSFVRNKIKYNEIYENYIDYSVNGKNIIKFIKIIINIFKSIFYINKSDFDLIVLNYFEMYLKYSTDEKSKTTVMQDIKEIKRRLNNQNLKK